MCSCLLGFRGAPPSCRPECVASSDCPLDKACSNQKCINPCQGTCGVAAECQVINHNPICSCPGLTTGDPFTRCIPIRKLNMTIHILVYDNYSSCSFISFAVLQQGTVTFLSYVCGFILFAAIATPLPTNPCQPSPCGPNSICQQTGGDLPSCQCMPEFIGAPPNCRPECIVNSECMPQMACINKKCQNPCLNACGFNAECQVVSHTAICKCPESYTGDAAVHCSPQRLISISTPSLSPCTLSPCGPNAECRERLGAGACLCRNGYYGNPYEECRPECVVSSDCPSNKACTTNKCIDPCPGTCASNADCQVVNHLPLCTCPQGLTGDPFRQCFKHRKLIYAMMLVHLLIYIKNIH